MLFRSVRATEGNGRFTTKMDQLNALVGPEAGMPGMWTVWDWWGKVQTLRGITARIKKWREDGKLKPTGGAAGGV